ACQDRPRAGLGPAALRSARTAAQDGGRARGGGGRGRGGDPGGAAAAATGPGRQAAGIGAAHRPGCLDCRAMLTRRLRSIIVLTAVLVGAFAVSALASS